MTDAILAANGEHTTNGVPKYASVLAPHVVVSPAKSALTFYQDVFGAKMLSVIESGDVVVHADLRFNGAGVTLSDPLDAYELKAPEGQGSVTYSLALYVSDMDDVVERAVRAGATLREPVSTFVSGDRYGSLLDPFGVRWAVMTRVEDLSAEESERRVKEWSASLG